VREPYKHDKRIAKYLHHFELATYLCLESDFDQRVP
jgi:hypothetical protein